MILINRVWRSFFIYAKTHGGKNAEKYQMPNVDETEIVEETDTESGQESGNSDETTTKTFSQEEVNKMIADRLDRERKKAEKAQAKAQEEAEAKQLEEQAKWQELAQKRQAKVDELSGQIGELETSQERVQALETAVSGYLVSLKANIGTAQLELLEQLPTEKQLEWLTKHGANLNGRGMPNTPDPQNGQTLTDEQKRKMAVKPSFR